MASANRRTREREATRERILAAARELFVAEGFEAVSMRKLAEVIEYTPAAIYTHFKDKHELLLALCDEDFGLLAGSMREVGEIDDPVERLRAMGRSYVRFAMEHPHHYRLMFMTTMPRYEVSEAAIEHGNPDEDGYACLRLAVAQCIASGRLRPEYSDADVVTQMCWGAAHGVVSLHITHKDDPWITWRRPLESAQLLLDSSIDGMLLRGDGRSRATAGGTTGGTTSAKTGEKTRVKTGAPKARARPKAGDAGADAGGGRDGGGTGRARARRRTR